MPKTTLLYPLQSADVGPMAAYGRIAERFGIRLWCGQSMQIETHALFAALTGMGVQVSFGTSVVLTPLRHPYHAAVEARSIAALSGQPFTAGFGPSGTSFQTNMYGARLDKPVAHTVDFVTKVRALLDGTPVAMAPGGPEMELLPLDDTPDIEVGMGVLRPAMARAAGRHSDAAITWLTPPGLLSDHLVPAADKAAREADRKAPRFVTVVQVAVTRPGRDMDLVAYNGTHQHLSLPHYVDMLQRSGLPVVHGDPTASARTLLDAGVVVTGTPDDIAEQLTVWHDAGADEIILNTSGVLITAGLGEALRDTTDILTAVAERAAG
ncbi:LLM class flavin-dependent oxidoreductase [Streptomyces sp. NBC_00996]|uniref:LLM class flavin-dependent oxidoreductase n=1 Tax=Streptomyces sp. NBC_00996 TaxID=2903710 RepID=UPI00386667BB|nr:LLM class flavin-dependent oxidoreductase [Streptomyces sp. NBC_00996]